MINSCFRFRCAIVQAVTSSSFSPFRPLAVLIELQIPLPCGTFQELSFFFGNISTAIVLWPVYKVGPKACGQKRVIIC